MSDSGSRRAFLHRVGLLTAAGLAGCTTNPGSTSTSETASGSAATTDATAGTTAADGSETADSPTASLPTEITTEPLATGFTSPVAVELPAGTPDRGYVVDQAGTVTVVPRHADSDIERSTFLDVRERMVSVSGYTERGLLGMAFHPDFPEDDRVFVRYSSPPRAGTPGNFSHTFVLAEFRATPDSADPDSERALLEIPQPQGNHNAGSVAFGPDGYLYVGVGDGGGANDRGTGHVDDWYDAVAGGNGQDVTENLLGSILRIDVDTSDNGSSDSDGGDSSDHGEYTIPDDNPLVGEDGLDEQYAWGFRNPWRISFDRETGALYAADVGQNEWEEVNRVVAGGNYGWNVKEATHCFGANDCPDTGPDGEPLRDPVIEYPHSGEAVSGISVIGGYLYRGDGTPGLRGRYVFADWRARKQLFVATPQSEGLWSVQPVPMEGSVGQNVLAFGEDEAGELYVCTTNESGVRGETGAVHRITGV
jgi:glucose/arabinose dehydrogenase